MKKFFWLSLLAASILGAANAASAAIIYEQMGIVSGQDEFSKSDTNGKHFIAQDFTIQDSWILNKLTFNAHTYGPEPVTDVYVNIYANDPTTLIGIGPQLSSQHITGSFTGKEVGTHWSYTLRDYTVSLADVTLMSGTYWVALHVDPYQGNGLSWTIAKDGTYPDSRVRRGYDSPTWMTDWYWTGWYYEHAFKLEGAPVPIPGAIWLLGSGVAALVGFRRTRQA